MGIETCLLDADASSMKPQATEVRQTPRDGLSARPGYGRLVAWFVLVGVLSVISFAGTAVTDHPQESDAPQGFYVDQSGAASTDQLFQPSAVSGSAAAPPQDDLFYRYSTGALLFFQFGLIFGLVLLIARGTRMRETFALHRPQSWRRAIAVTVAALGATYVLLLVVGLALGPGNEPDQGIPTFWDSSRFGPFILSFVAVAIVAPVVEELTFRGLGYSLLQPFGARAAIVGTALPFGLMHGFVLALPLFVVVGLSLAWLRTRTGSVYPGMLMHGTFNAAAIVLTVSFG